MKKINLYIIILLLSIKSVAQFDVIGSNNYGRILDITYHPTIQNKLFASTAGNHIVTSNDNGQTWELFYSHPIRDIFIQNLKIYDTNSLVFTVDVNYGTWNDLYILDINTATVVDTYTIPLPDFADESEITSYDILKSNPDNAIVQQIYSIGGSRFGKVYYTTNHGLSWKEIYYTGNYDAIFPNSVAIHPQDPTKLFIARIGGNDPFDWGGLFISNDSGLTWEEKFSGIDFGPIAFKPDNPNEILIGTTLGSLVQNLYKSNDGGINWTNIDKEWANIMPSGIFTIKYSPTNFNKILVLGLSERVLTENNFATYEVFLSPNNIENVNNYFFGSNASINPFLDNQVFITNNDYPLFTDNFGATVSKVNNPYFFAIGQLNLYKNGTEKHLYHSLQNGYLHVDMINQTETPFYLTLLQAFPNYQSTYNSDEKTSGRFYNFTSSFTGASFAVSNNHGATNISFPLPYQFIHSIVSESNNPNKIYLSVSNDFSNADLISVDITNPNNIIITNVTLPVQGYISSIFIDPINNSDKIIAINSTIYKTNNGLNWTNSSTGLEILNPSEDRIYKIVQNPLNSIQYTIATSKGVFTSLNSGNTWSQVSQFHCQDVYHSSEMNNHIVAVELDDSSSNLSIRYSTNSGQQWKEISWEAIKYVTSNSVKIEFVNETIIAYLATYDLGIVSYTIDVSNLGTTTPNRTKQNVILFPNPATNEITINTTNEFETTDIYNMLGEKVIKSNHSTIDVSKLAKGTYIVKVKNHKNEVFITKLLKK